MPKGDVPADIVYLVCIWLEAIVYGFFFCLFCGTMYVNLGIRRKHHVHSLVMFIISIVFFLIATMHVAMNCYRMVMAYVIRRDAPGGPVGYIGQLAPWDHVFKDTLYATQEILGDAVAVYRVWVVWGHDWKPVVLPGALLIVSLISGYSVCGLYPTEDPNSTVFDPRLLSWITTFYAITVVQGGLTTGLVAYKIWQTEQVAAKFRMHSTLKPVLLILIESASIQFIAEVILLALYSANYNAQYLVLEPVTPLVGITFCAITIRVALTNGQNGQPSGPGSRGKISSSGGRRGEADAVQTIGSVPLRPLKINVHQDVDEFADTEDESTYSRKNKGTLSDETFPSP